LPRILIVDDDDATRELLGESLKSDYEIVETSDPERALAITLGCKPDAILLDLSMPKLSAFELCQTLSSLSFTRHIPIFIVGAGDTRNKAFCESLGASGYFQKPVELPVLKARLEAVLRDKKGAERRTEMRFQLKVTLKLFGKHANGKDFEMHATTDDMSAGGFLCVCAAPLEMGTTVEVFLCRGGDHYLGTARVVRKAPSDSTLPRYGFSFSKKIEIPVA
jgi:DNA-binding response OmpR family regulator